MRLGKTAWFILGSGIFIIAFISLFVGFSRLSGEQGKVEDSLSSAQDLLPQLISQEDDLTSQLTELENQLAQAESSLSRSAARFPEAVESIEYDEELFMIAHDCGLEVFSLTASEPSDIKVKVGEETVTYTITIFEVEVRPTAPPPFTKAYIDTTIANMLAFINNIVTGEYFTTADIEIVDIKAPKPDETGKEMSATIRLVIYSYKGE